MEIVNLGHGWWWHFTIHNYITGEIKSFNSSKPFETYEQAFLDLAKFIKENMKC